MILVRTYIFFNVLMLDYDVFVFIDDAEGFSYYVLFKLCSYSYTYLYLITRFCGDGNFKSLETIGFTLRTSSN